MNSFTGTTEEDYKSCKKKSGKEKYVRKNLLDKKSKKVKLQSNKFTAKTPAVNTSVKKSVVEVSTPKTKYTIPISSAKKVRRLNVRQQ